MVVYNKIMKNSIGTTILNEFLKPQFKYKGISVNMFGLPSFSKDFSRASFSNQFARFKRRGFIEKEGEFLRLTKKGKEYIKRKQDSPSVFYFSFPKNSPKNLLVMYDIPESKKAEREWFRFHLKKFGYEMIQRSVWVGPSPLPADFLEYIKEIKLKSYIKTFKLSKAYRI